jgi:hypothetical protein
VRSVRQIALPDVADTCATPARRTYRDFCFGERSEDCRSKISIGFGENRLSHNDLDFDAVF